MPITLPDEIRTRVQQSLQEYFAEHFDIDLGILQMEKLYDFLIAMIGPAVYNQAVADAQAWMQVKLLDVEGDLHEQVEFEDK